MRERGIHENFGALVKDTAIGQAHGETDSESLRLDAWHLLGKCSQEQYP